MIIQGLVVSIHLKENLPVDNINYLLMTCNFMEQIKTLDNCFVKLILMPTSRIILTTLRNLKAITNLSLLLL